MPLKSMKDAWPSRAAYARERHRTRSPVSEFERSALMKERAAPKSERHLTPGGSIEQSVCRQTEAARETRIGFITKRLERQRMHARDGFNHSR